MSGGALEAVRLPVEGMTCGSCVGRIARAVRKVDGVRGVSVDLGAQHVTVRRSTDTASVAELVTAIEAAGYRTDPGAAVAVAPARTLLGRLLGRR